MTSIIWRFAALTALAASLLATASAVHFIQDEFLWTKGTWADYKLKFPLEHFGFGERVKHSDTEQPAAARNVTGAGADDTPADLRRRLPAEASTAALEAALQKYEDVSLKGAVRPSSGSGQAHAGITLSAGPPLVTIETDASVPKAAEVIKCQVCQHFVEEAAKSILQWLLEGPGRRLSRRRLVEYLPEICQWEVPQQFLRENVIMEGAVTDSKKRGDASLGPRTDPAAGNLIVVSRRHAEVTKIHELRSVRSACTLILAPLIEEAEAGAAAQRASASAAGSADGDITPEPNEIVSAITDAMRNMVSELERIPGLGYSTGRANGIVITADAEDGPALQDSCQDHNPGCANWAKWGECEQNTKYMLGHEEWPGNCRLSCNACSLPAHVRNRFLTGSQSAALLAAAEGLVTSLERRVCSDAPPCQSSVAKVLSREFANVRAMARGGLGFATDEHGAETQLPPTRWPASRVVLVRRTAEALTGRPEAAPPAPEPAGPPPVAEQALARALHDRCLYTDAGWWSFELCWQLHVRQFHVPETVDKIQRAHALGVYDVEASAKLQRSHGRAVPTLPAAQLLKGTAGSAVPYFPQLYTGGTACPVGDREVPRSIEVRTACSPEADTMHILVLEPSPCSYVLVLYTPVLCRFSGYTPTWRGAADTALEAQQPQPSEANAAASQEKDIADPAAGAVGTTADLGQQMKPTPDSGSIQEPIEAARSSSRPADGQQQQKAASDSDVPPDHQEL